MSGQTSTIAAKSADKDCGSEVMWVIESVHVNTHTYTHTHSPQHDPVPYPNHSIITNSTHLLGNKNISAFHCSAPQQQNQMDPGHPVNLSE